MNANMVLQLQNTRLLRAVTASAVASLARIARQQTLPAGALVCSSGDVHAPVLFVLSGMVRVFEADAEGREQTLAMVGEGEALNLPVAFDGDGTAPASIQVWSESATLVQIPAHGFAEAVAHDPALATAVLGALAARARHLSKLVADLSLRSVRQRLANFLLGQAENSQNGDPARWTHAAIAARLGTAREVVSRQMRALVNEGVIRQERQRLVIADLGLLREIAES
jgi:CRP/FNR family transcriptional regulator